MSKKIRDFRNYPLDKYKYIVVPERRMVIATTSYCGMLVKGVARCAEGDEFNVEKGKKIAAYKCNLKVAIKRLEALYGAKAYDEIMIQSLQEDKAELEEIIDAATVALDDAVTKLDNAIDE